MEKEEIALFSRLEKAINEKDEYRAMVTLRRLSRMRACASISLVSRHVNCSLCGVLFREEKLLTPSCQRHLYCQTCIRSHVESLYQKNYCKAISST